MPPQMPSALLRSPPSSNMFITIESAAGSTIAAPSPCSPRIAIKNESVVASAQPRELAADRRQRDVHDRQVDDRHEVRDREHREGAPAMDGRLHSRGFRYGCQSGHRFLLVAADRHAVLGQRSAAAAKSNADFEAPL